MADRRIWTSGPTHDSIENLLAEVASAPDIPLPIELEAGTVINDAFEIVDRLGAGGMGVVYRALDTRLSREVALKLHTGRAHRRAYERLLAEAKAMAKLSHPNVLTVHEIGTYRDNLFIAMECVEGGTVRSWLAEDRPGPEEIVDVFVAAGRGLEAAHRAGVVHRDFKPDNVLIGEGGRVCVGDFGLARAVGELERRVGQPGTGSPSLTATGALLGTPAYMAPEQLAGGQVDARSDQFSFCVALWEALAGKLPFEGETPTAIAESIEHGNPTRPPLPDSIPRRVSAALRRGLAVDPDERFGSMAELLGAIGPRRRSSAGTWVAFAVAAAAAAAAVVFAIGNDRQASVLICEAPDPSLGGIWSAGRSSSIERAFVATDVAYAATAFATVADRIGRYSAELADHRERACRERGASSEAMYERRLLCLRRRERMVGQLLDLWVAADRSVVESAVEAAGSLPVVADCGSSSFLLTAVKPPPPSSAASVAEVRAELDRIRVLTDSGMLAAAERELAAALPRARAAGYLPAVAEALALAGHLAQLRDRFDEAESALRRGYLAARRSRDRNLEGELAARLAMVVGLHRNDPPEAEMWASLARIEVEAGASATLELQVLDVLGALADFGGRYEEALDHRTRALNLATSVYQDDHPKVGVAIQKLAATHHALGQLERAGELYERAIPLVEALGPSHPSVALLLRSAGLVNAFTGRVPRAIDQLERSLAIAEASFGSDALDTGYAALNLGVALSMGKHFDQAIARYHRALAIVVARLGQDHPDVSLCLNSLAVAHEGLEQFDQALEYHEQALAVALGQGEKHPQVAVIRGNIGAVYTEMGENARALGPLREAIALWDSIGPGNSKVVFPLASLGEALIGLGRHREARAPLERARDLLASNGRDPDLGARVLFGLAQVLWSAAERVGAIEHAERASAAYRSRFGRGGERAAAVERWLAERRRPGVR